MSVSSFINTLFTKIIKNPAWVILTGLAVFIKIFSLFPAAVETYYTYGLYPVISKIQRFLLGWIPFSIGDLFYGFLGLIILIKTFQLFKTVFKKQFNKAYLISGLKQLLFFVLFVYVFFNALWGLNYNRKGIAYQLKLDVKKYTVQDLDTLSIKLHERLNFYAAQIDTIKREQLEKKSIMFKQAAEAYHIIEKKYPFLTYHPKSLKPSIYSYVSHYIGFYGYYNPFSGEGQVQTIVPVFVQPYVACHEIAHQVGYAKENEANFVGYLACKESLSVDFKYSVYYDMFTYASGDLFKKDTALAKELSKNMHVRVKRDTRDLRNYFLNRKNGLEPFMSGLYSNFLKMNNQPNGKETYNEVVAWLIAYYKKYGIESL
jgi:Protein of unknown function (DUF3810)